MKPKQAIPPPENNGIATQRRIDQASRPVRELTPEMIARRAYEIWECRGRPIGSGIEDWLTAEAELKTARHFRVGRRQRATAPGAKASAAVAGRAASRIRHS